MFTSFNHTSLLILSVSFLPFLFFGCKSGKKALINKDIFNINSNEYIINQPFDAQGKTYDISNKTLTVNQEGALKNAKLIGSQSKLIVHCKSCLENISFVGEWSGSSINLESIIKDPQASSINNYRTLKNLLSANMQVVLSKTYPINYEGVWVDNQVRNVRIRGTNEHSGLILENKQNNTYKYVFQSDDGVNIFLENITISSLDYNAGKKFDTENRYFFSGACYQSQFVPNAKPDIDSIKIENCRVNGAISLAGFASHSNNQSLAEFKQKNHVETLIIKDNEFYSPSTPFSFSNMSYGNVLIDNNKITNLSQAFLSFPASDIDERYYNVVSERKQEIKFTNNRITNELVIPVAHDRALSPFVVKGGGSRLIFKGNHITNLLSNTKDSHVYTHYFTCNARGEAILEDNIFINVIGKGSRHYPASLIKQRGATNLTIRNNKFSVDINSLVKIGVIPNDNYDLSMLSGKDFYCSFMECGNGTALDKTYLITGNEFKVPFLNRSTQILDVANFVFEGNSLEIGTFGRSDLESVTSRDGSMFLARQRFQLPNENKGGDWISKNNLITIHKSVFEKLKWIHYPEGTQNGYGQNIDLKYNYNKVQYQDIIQTKDLCFSYQMPDAVSQEYNISINGKNTCFELIDFGNANHLRPNSKNLSSHVHVEDYQNVMECSPFVPIKGSKQIIDIAEYRGSNFELMIYSYLNSLFNYKAEGSSTVVFEVSYISQTNQQNNLIFELVLDHRTRTITLNDEKEGPSRVAMTKQEKNKKTESLSSYRGSGTSPFIKIVQGIDQKSNVKIILENTYDIKSMSIKCSIS